MTWQRRHHTPGTTKGLKSAVHLHSLDSLCLTVYFWQIFLWTPEPCPWLTNYSTQHARPYLCLPAPYLGVTCCRHSPAQLCVLITGKYRFNLPYLPWKQARPWRGALPSRAAILVVWVVMVTGATSSYSHHHIYHFPTKKYHQKTQLTNQFSNNYVWNRFLGWRLFVGWETGKSETLNMTNWRHSSDLDVTGDPVLVTNLWNGASLKHVPWPYLMWEWEGWELIPMTWPFLSLIDQRSCLGGHTRTLLVFCESWSWSWSWLPFPGLNFNLLPLLCLFTYSTFL